MSQRTIQEIRTALYNAIGEGDNHPILCEAISELAALRLARPNSEKLTCPDVVQAERSGIGLELTDAERASYVAWIAARSGAADFWRTKALEAREIGGRIQAERDELRRQLEEVTAERNKAMTAVVDSARLYAGLTVPEDRQRAEAAEAKVRELEGK